jgi:hypothetical protein
VRTIRRSAAVVVWSDVDDVSLVWTRYSDSPRVIVIWLLQGGVAHPMPADVEENPVVAWTT